MWKPTGRLLLCRPTGNSVASTKRYRSRYWAGISGGTKYSAYPFEYPLPPEAYELVEGKPTPETVTRVEESREDFRYVAKLLHRHAVPAPPKHDVYPTPSGWVPPADHVPDLPYFVPRTKYHNLPVYLDKAFHQTKIMTKINNVEGDIWQFRHDLVEFLMPFLREHYVYSKEKMPTQVAEMYRVVRIKGDHVMATKKFLLDRGF